MVFEGEEIHTKGDICMKSPSQLTTSEIDHKDKTSHVNMINFQQNCEGAEQKASE